MVFVVAHHQMREHAIKCIIRIILWTGISRTLDQSFHLLGHVGI